MIEALIRGKSYIYPKYFHKGEMIYEEFGACWKVNSYDELEAALRKKNEQRDYKPYPQSSVDKFLNEAIFNGFDQKDILDGYVDYINSVANS